MEKLRLDLDTLAVETFDTGQEVEGEGTVFAHVSGLCSRNPDNTCGQWTCNGTEYTCARSCGDCGSYECTADESCYAACNTTWTQPDYVTCDANESCGMSCTGGCATQIC